MSAMASLWCVGCDSWNGNLSAYGETNVSLGQVVTHARLVRKLGSFRRPPFTRENAAATCAWCTRCMSHAVSSDASNEGDKRERQQLLCKTFFLDHTRWWDSRRQKRKLRSPDFRHKDSREALWLQNCYKPFWLDLQLALPKAWVDPAEFFASARLSSDDADQFVGPGYENRLTLEFVRKLCKQGQVKEAVEILKIIVETSSGIDNYLVYCVLKECMARKHVMLGGQVHVLAVQMGFGSDTFLCSHFIRMYAARGKLREAMDVFRGVALPDAFTWSAIISAHTKQGQAGRAIELYQEMRTTRAKPDNYVFVAALQACAAAGDLRSGKQLHLDIEEHGSEPDVAVGSSLVNMYARCGSLRDARMMFDGLREKDVVTWRAMLAGYAQQEDMGQDALSLYSAMGNEGMVVPNAVTFVCLLQACANMGVSALEKGKKLHSEIKERGVQSDVAVGASLVNMYAKCGGLRDARVVFDGLHEKNVVTWNAMITGYAQEEGMGQEALSLYSTMRNEDMVDPNAVTFVCLLQACANMGSSALERGKQLHTEIKERGVQSDVAVAGSLMNMYVKCGGLRNARVVFDGLRERNVVTWNAMIAGYAQQEGMGQESLSLYSAMRNESVVAPNAVTFVCLLQACANIGVSASENGKQLHSEITERGLQWDVAVGGSLVNMYSKCGSLRDARTVFDGLREKNVVTWNAMIAGYAQQEGMGQDALSLYIAMRNEHMVVPDAATFVCLLQACANMGASALEKGQQLHSDIKARGVQSDVAVGGSLVNMYVKCGSLMDARIVFDGLCEKNVVTWSAMIAGYAQQEGMGQDALSLYSAMRNEGKVVPDAVTFVCLLKACANMGASALEKGKQVHSEVTERCVQSHVALGASLVNMYVKCGSLRDARIVFDGLREKDVVTWCAMMAGYAQQEGMGQDALSLYTAMRNEGMVVPDALTFVCLLQACASVAALQQGKELHSDVRDEGLESDALIGTCLVNMYAQCGRLEISRQVFDRLPMKRVESWNALINGYAEHGDGDMAIQCFEELLEQGIQPDDVTYICLLTACSRAGLVVEGQQYFDAMEERHGVQTDERHYGCMVDLFGRSGHLGKAEQMLLGAPCLASSVVSWRALLSACKSYGDVDLGRRCFEHLVNLEPKVATAYVLLGSIYANAGRWEEVEKVEILRKAAGARKKAAEVQKEVHKFAVGEERADVADTLRKMNTRAKEGGHVLQTQLVLSALSEQEKEDALCGHAEKLALAYGLLNTPAGSSLLVTKNLRMCNDCHSSTKIMSRVEKREIIVRGYYPRRLNGGVREPGDDVQRGGGVLGRQMRGEPAALSAAASNLVNQHPSAAAAAAAAAAACAAAAAVVMSGKREKDGAFSAHTLGQLCATGPLTRAVAAVVDLAAAAEKEHTAVHVVSTWLLCTLIQRCGADKNLALGHRLDDLTVKLGYASDAYLGNHLVRMYARQGRLQDATRVFGRVARPSGHMWFSIISAHTRHGRPRRAIQLYHEMRRSSAGSEPTNNSHVFVAALQACAREGDLACGRQVHSHVVQSGVQVNCFVGNALVDMYAKCRDLDAARRVFDAMVVATRDAVTWNTMINGYADHGLGREALALYASMERDGRVSATRVTFACLLKACASAGALQQGRRLHAQLVRRRLLLLGEEGDDDVVLGTCLVNMYVKCGKVDDARAVFDGMPKTDAVAWNAMLSGYVEHGRGMEALSLYARMEQQQQGLGSVADGVTYACLLKACASARALQQGRQLHLRVVERGLLLLAHGGGDNNVVLMVGNAVVDMYAKCGQLEDARAVFDGLGARNAATWTAMINGYAEHGQGGAALALYASMEEQQQKRQQEGGEGGGGLVSAAAADSVTYACLLRACASAGALRQGRRLHQQVVEKGMLLLGEGGGDDAVVVVLGTCLVDMYVKCGEVEEAGRVFDGLAAKNAVTWTAMINGYAEHGLGQQALTLYDRMEQEGLVVADSVTFACLLKACASAGAVRQGRRLHSQIVERGLLLLGGKAGGGGGDDASGVMMGSCLVNMYAKCGDLDSARAVFDSLAAPVRGTVTWNTMIGGYGSNNDGHQAIACFQEMLAAGVRPDAATFTCLLVACSHEGLVTQGREYFDAITKVHGLSPTADHYVCMVDLLGRAGHLAEAEAMLVLLSSSAEEGGRDPNPVGLMALLHACKSGGDVARGARCFERLVALDPHNASAYVLMAALYAAADRWADADRIERLRRAAGACKKPAVAGIEVKQRVHTFVVGEGEAGGGEEDGVVVVAGKARRTSARLKDEWNRAPQTGVVVKPGMSEAAKEEQLCGHAEKLALAYGLLHTPDGAPLLVTKNLRMCGDCHSATEVMSRVEGRAIVVRDSHRVHRFEAGFCSCKGRC